MTRIVAGVWGGRRLLVPAGRQVRPTAERVREAWLNILNPQLPGARVLDLFAGSGALGLEALSRGADRATFVEKHASSLAALNANIAALQAGARCQVVREDALHFLERVGPEDYDIIVADPPFASTAVGDILAWRERVPFRGTLAVEHSPRTVVSGADTRRWGDIAVSFFQRP